jgi:hypothetical protein
VSGNVVDLARVRQAKTQRRGARGRFAVRRSPEELLDVIREVAEEAARRWPEDCPDPTRVSQQVWNTAKHALAGKHGWIPNANAACQQLRKATGRPLSWGSWVLLAFADDRDRRLSALLAEPPRAPLAEADIALALHLIARRGRNENFSAFEYDRVRREQINELAAAGRNRSHAQRLLPSSEHIITACGSWEAARRIAGFGTTRRRRKRRALSVDLAIAFFYSISGYLPKRPELIAFAAQENFSLEKFRDGWATCIEGGRTAIAAHPELPPPPPYGVRTPPNGWHPVEIDVGPSPEMPANTRSSPR